MIRETFMLPLLVSGLDWENLGRQTTDMAKSHLMFVCVPKFKKYRYLQVFAIWTWKNNCYNQMPNAIHPNKRKSYRLCQLVNSHSEYIQGVPKKRPNILNAQNSLKNDTRNKSRMSFINLRKFSFWWALKLKLFNFDLRGLRKWGLKLVTLCLKHNWIDFSSGLDP